MIFGLRVKPGGHGNPVAKINGDTFGAKITFKHQGLPMTVDVGWVAHAEEDYVWATYYDLYIPRHYEAAVISVDVTGVWAHWALPPGREIAAQAVVAPARAIRNEISIKVVEITPAYATGVDWTRKMDTHLTDISAILERTYTSPKPYVTLGPGHLSDIGGVGV